MAPRTLFLLLIGFVGPLCIIMMSCNQRNISQEKKGTICVCVLVCVWISCCSCCVSCLWLVWLFKYIICIVSSSACGISNLIHKHWIRNLTPDYIWITASLIMSAHRHWERQRFALWLSPYLSFPHEKSTRKQQVKHAPCSSWEENVNRRKKIFYASTN